MRSRILTYMAAATISAALTAPIRLVAQTEQAQHSNQSNNFVKDSEGTSTVAECIGDPSSGNADTRPDAHAFTINGRCEVNRKTKTLTGNCRNVTPSIEGPCAVFRPQECPPGARPINPGNDISCHQAVFDDYGRICPLT
jgi:hypothetical protein